MNKRIYVEKKESYQQEANALRTQLSQSLGSSLNGFRSLVIYDVFNIDEEMLERAKASVFSEPMIEDCIDTIDLKANCYLAMEPLDGQFDQRADSAMQCLRLLDPKCEVTVRSGRVLLFEPVNDQLLVRIKTVMINPVEMQEKNLEQLSLDDNALTTPVEVFDDFIKYDEEQIRMFHASHHLAMSHEDLVYVQNYFKDEERNPTETELRILDTYWSDHCRHTTFNTHLTDITFGDDNLGLVIEETFREYLRDRERLNRNKRPITLMDLATINARLERTFNPNSPIEVSDEVNACSVVIDVENNGNTE